MIQPNALSEALARRRSSKFSLRQKRKNRPHIETLRAAYEAETAGPLKEALESAIQALGGKMRKKLPGDKIKTANLGMGAIDKSPGNSDNAPAAPKGRKPKADFAAPIQTILDSRPDLKEKLMEVAQIKTQPLAVRVMQMRKIVSDNPPPAAGE